MIIDISLVSQTAFPRVSSMDSLIHVIRHQPKLAKDASYALIDIGQAILSTARPDELRVLLRGTLLQEVYARNSCLQTLQVRLSNDICSNNLTALAALRPDRSGLVSRAMDR